MFIANYKCFKFSICLTLSPLNFCLCTLLSPAVEVVAKGAGAGEAEAVLFGEVFDFDCGSHIMVLAVSVKR